MPLESMLAARSDEFQNYRDLVPCPQNSYYQDNHHYDRLTEFARSSAPSINAISPVYLKERLKDVNSYRNYLNDSNSASAPPMVLPSWQQRTNEATTHTQMDIAGIPGFGRGSTGRQRVLSSGLTLSSLSSSRAVRKYIRRLQKVKAKNLRQLRGRWILDSEWKELRT